MSNSNDLIANPLTATPQTRMFAFIPSNGTNARSADGSVSVQDIVNQVPTNGVQIILRKGTDAERLTTLFADGEPVWTTDTKKVFVGDGVTVGGVPVGGGSGGLMGSYDSFIVVATTNSATTNATNLLAAYENAKLLTPNGVVLSATNRASVILPPARYDFGDDGEFILNGDFIDVIGLTSDRSNQYLTSNHTGAGKGTLHEISTGINVVNLTVNITGMNPFNQDGTDPAALYVDGAVSTLNGTNCEFMCSDFIDSSVFSMSDLKEFAGTWINCKASDRAFGAFGKFSGYAKGCMAGNQSFGTGDQFTGQAYECTAGQQSFCYNTSGFSSTAKVIGCVCDTFSVGGDPADGALIDVWFSFDNVGGHYQFPTLGGTPPPSFESVADFLPWTIPSTLGIVSVGVSARYNFNLGAHVYSNIVFDTGGNLYVSDTGNQVIRKITPAGIVSTFAGTMSVEGSASGGVGVGQFSRPGGLAIDVSDNIYVVDANNCLLRKVDTSGVISTFAGALGGSPMVDGNGTSAKFDRIFGITFDGTNLYVSDRYAVRQVTLSADVLTVAGSGTAGSDNGQGAAASFGFINDITCDGAGNLYVVEGNYGVRKIDSGFNVTNFCFIKNPNGQTSLKYNPVDSCLYTGAYSAVFKIDSGGNLASPVTIGDTSNSGYADGNGTSARFNGLSGGCIHAGSFYIVDANNELIRKIDLATLDTTTVSGTYNIAGASNLSLGPVVGNVSISTYLINSMIVLDASNVTFNSNRTVTLSIAYLYGPSGPPQFIIDNALPVPGTQIKFNTGVRSGFTGTLGVIPMPPMVAPPNAMYYVLLAQLSAAPDSGSLEITYGKMTATPTQQVSAFQVSGGT